MEVVDVVVMFVCKSLLADLTDGCLRIYNHCHLNLELCLHATKKNEKSPYTFHHCPWTTVLVTWLIPVHSHVQ